MTGEQLLKEYASAIKGVKHEELERIHQYYLGYTRAMNDDKTWNDDTYFQIRKELSRLTGLARGGK